MSFFLAKSENDQVKTNQSEKTEFENVMVLTVCQFSSVDKQHCSEAGSVNALAQSKLS